MEFVLQKGACLCRLGTLHEVYQPRLKRRRRLLITLHWQACRKLMHVVYGCVIDPWPMRPAETQEAERKRIEAQGIADFQKIVSQVRALSCLSIAPSVHSNMRMA